MSCERASFFPEVIKRSRNSSPGLMIRGLGCQSLDTRTCARLRSEIMTSQHNPVYPAIVSHAMILFLLLKLTNPSSG